VLTVSQSISAGKETSAKSRRTRTVPLAAQAIAAFECLLERANFKSRDDFVLCGPAGGRLDGSAVRARFIRAQKKAQLRVRRFHDLRHTFGTLAIRRFDLVNVREMMGHAQLTTTERYLHSKPRPSDAAKLTALLPRTTITNSRSRPSAAKRDQKGRQGTGRGGAWPNTSAARSCTLG
jgi:integrase